MPELTYLESAFNKLTLFKFSNKNNRRRCLNMFKVNYKNTRTTSGVLSCLTIETLEQSVKYVQS